MKNGFLLVLLFVFLSRGLNATSEYRMGLSDE
jgi:hypothetical protein